MSKVVDIEPYIAAKRSPMPRFVRPIVDYPEVKEERSRLTRELNEIIDQYFDDEPEAS